MLLLRDDTNESIVSGVSLPFIFDKFIYERESGARIIDPFLKSYKSLSNHTAPHAKWVQQFVNNKAYSEGKRLYKASTQKSSLVFRIPSRNSSEDVEDVTLETSYSPFKTGSSLSHLDREAYFNTEEYLMRSEAEPGKTLAQITPKSMFPVGDKTRKMLKAMGYDVVTEGLPEYGLGYNSALGMAGTWAPFCIITLSVYFL
jgi:hypothetical protein